MTGPDHHREVMKWLADLMCRPEEPLVGSFSNSLSHAGVERLCAAMGAEEPGNNELRLIGAFDRSTRIGKHQATNVHHLRATIQALDAAGFTDAADTLVWQVWHQVNGVARAREYHRIAAAETASSRATADRALAVLRSVEWSSETDMEEGDHEAACPCCDGPRRLGHEPGCRLASVLTESEAV